jgi:hypothetical protein
LPTATNIYLLILRRVQAAGAGAEGDVSLDRYLRLLSGNAGDHWPP